MNTYFQQCTTPPLVDMFAADTADALLRGAQAGAQLGAEACCMLLASLAEPHTPAAYRQIFSRAGLPVYATNYRDHQNEGKDDSTLASELIAMAESGAALCDVMGDLFDPTPGEMTEHPAAIRQQIALIAQLHRCGASVLMSSHVKAHLTADQVLRIALNQQNRGADIVKIVVTAQSMAEQLENLAITERLRAELSVPFLFLSNGVSAIHRRVGPMMGCCMYLCVRDDTAWPKPDQPSLRAARAIRDNWWIIPENAAANKEEP